MSTVVIELPTEHLRMGLYVSRLDRPWEDTPFLFQGFVIESDEDLQTLCRLCKVVYVEVSVDDAEQLKSAVGKASATTLVSEAPDPLENLSRNLTATVAQVPIKDSTSLEAELALARDTYGEAKRAVTTVFDHLRRGGGLDVPHLQSVVGSMVDSVLRNREAMGWLASMKDKDDYLYNHSLAASVWALAFGRHLGLDKETLTLVGTGAMLLDIGKTCLTTELLKKPCKPSDEEWQLIRAQRRLRHQDRGSSAQRGQAKSS